MANAKRDENGKTTVIATLSTDGTAIVNLAADPVSHRLKIDDGTTGSDNGNNNGNAQADENEVPVWTAVSSSDGSIVEVYATATGQLFINSN